MLVTIGLFYYTLGNLTPKLRSQLASIQLLAIVKTKMIKKYTMTAILKPIVDDIMKLVCATVYYVYIAGLLL